MTATVGQKLVYFVCYARENVYWYFNKRLLPHNTQITHQVSSQYSVLKIFNVQVINEGEYTCHANIRDYFFESVGVLVVRRKSYMLLLKLTYSNIFCPVSILIM